MVTLSDCSRCRTVLLFHDFFLRHKTVSIQTCKTILFFFFNSIHEKNVGVQSHELGKRWRGTHSCTYVHTHTHTHIPADDTGMLAEETSVFWPSDVLMMATGLARLGGGGGGGGSIPGAKNCGSFVGLFIVGDVWPDCCEAYTHTDLQHQLLSQHCSGSFSDIHTLL